MKLVTDECVPLQVVERLRRDGHDVSYVLDEDPGVSDEQILERSVASGVPVLTEDKDFGDLVFERGKGASGVVLMRLRNLSSELKAEITARAIAERGAEIATSFVVISPGQVRVRTFDGPDDEQL